MNSSTKACPEADGQEGEKTGAVTCRKNEKGEWVAGHCLLTAKGS